MDGGNSPGTDYPFQNWSSSKVEKHIEQIRKWNSEEIAKLKNKPYEFAKYVVITDISKQYIFNDKDLDKLIDGLKMLDIKYSAFKINYSLEKIGE